MRGVLVDDDEAVAGLRHDIGLVHLRARGAERPVEQVGRGLGDATRVSAAGAPTSKAACAASAKPAPQRGAARCGSGARASAASPSRRAAARAGRNAAMVALPPVVAARWPSRAQRLLQRAHDERAHQAGVAEAHLGLGRMHVDVDLARIERHEQRDDRMAVARQIVGIGAAHRADAAACRAPAGR